MAGKEDRYTFGVRVDDGPERTIEVATGRYDSAAAAVPALLGIDHGFPIRVTIWLPELLPKFGPHDFIVNKPGGEAVLSIRREQRRSVGP